MLARLLTHATPPPSVPQLNSLLNHITPCTSPIGQFHQLTQPSPSTLLQVCRVQHPQLEPDDENKLRSPEGGHEEWGQRDENREPPVAAARSPLHICDACGRCFAVSRGLRSHIAKAPVLPPIHPPVHAPAPVHVTGDRRKTHTLFDSCPNMHHIAVFPVQSAQSHSSRRLCARLLCYSNVSMPTPGLCGWRGLGTAGLQDPAASARPGMDYSRSFCDSH